MESCKLIHLKRNGADGYSYALMKDSELVLGRDPECDFRVQVPSVSDKHAKLIVDHAGKVYVSSLVPNAPVKLNDINVAGKPAVIADGGILSIGTCSFRFVYNRKCSTSPLVEAANTVSTPSKVQIAIVV